MESDAIKLITGNPKKAINALMVPILISTVLNLFSNIVDALWVVGLGPDAVAALGFNTPLFLILTGVGVGIGAGANSLISRYIGAKDHDSANNAAIHSVFISIIITVITTVLLLIFLKPMLILLGAENVLDYAVSYGMWVSIGAFATLMANIFAGIFRAEGAIKRATYPLMAAAVLNMLLDPVLIYTLNFGVAGAAIATQGAQALALIVMAYWMFIKKDTYFDFSLKKYYRKLQIYKDILAVGLPASVEQVLIAVLTFVSNWVVVVIAGTDAVACYTIAWRVVALLMVPAISIGVASVTVTGVNFGAKNFTNLKIGQRYALKLGCIIMFSIFALLNIFAGPIAIGFTYDPSSAHLTPLVTEMLRMISFFLLPLPFGILASNVFQGMGKGLTALAVTFSRTGFSILFTLILVFGFAWNLFGVYIGLDVGTILGCAIGFIYLEYTIKKLNN